jgi:hypothetical protein
MPPPISTNAKVNAERQKFYDWLSPKDKLIHDLAVKMLKTRYTPERSNAWKARVSTLAANSVLPS